MDKDLIMIIVGIIAAVIIIFIVVVLISIKRTLDNEILETLGFTSWNIVPEYADRVIVRSRQTFETYDDVKYFKEEEGRFVYVQRKLEQNGIIVKKLRDFLADNDFKKRAFYGSAERKISEQISFTYAYRVVIVYVTRAGNNYGQRTLSITQANLTKFINNPSILMGKAAYNKQQKEIQKEELEQKQHQFYKRVNTITDYTSKNKGAMILNGKKEELDSLIAQLFDRTVNSIKKVKTVDSEEWKVIDKFISEKERDIKKIVSENQRLRDYYKSSEFQKIKETCSALMSSQREFNEYINEKVKAISSLFGMRVLRNETVTKDENNYIRPYKKSITPFTADVSSTVFASAENNPLEYIVKYFYPNKSMYPEQIQKLHFLVEELETLREAKQIIEKYKKDYRQYLSDVPSYVMQADETGFYSRLGFAYIDEKVLTVEYKFTYTSEGGYAQRSFTVPMTEENIVELIKLLESKLTAGAFSKEQRLLMTKKLREAIKSRDNYTCCICGNSTHAEPNLLLEIDHIVPIAKGGLTEETNLQTLCWKCNRSKSDKLI